MSVYVFAHSQEITSRLQKNAISLPGNHSRPNAAVEDTKKANWARKAHSRNLGPSLKPKYGKGKSKGLVKFHINIAITHSPPAPVFTFWLHYEN